MISIIIEAEVSRMTSEAVMSVMIHWEVGLDRHCLFASEKSE